MNKLIITTMLGTVMLIGAFAATNQTDDTAMDAEPTVFSMDAEAPDAPSF